MKIVEFVENFSKLINQNTILIINISLSPLFITRFTKLDIRTYFWDE